VKKLNEIWESLKCLENISEPENDESGSTLKNFTEESEESFAEMNVEHLKK